MNYWQLSLAIPLSILLSSAASAQAPAVVVQIRGDNLEVSALQTPHRGGVRNGVVIWTEDGRERWAPPADGSPPTGGLPVSIARGSDESASALSLQSQPLDQLLGVSILRGTVLLTPAPNSRLLSGRVSFRRQPDKKQALPASKAELVSGNQVIAKLIFSEGQQTLRWNDLAGLPEALKAGLAPGEYVFRYDDGTGATPFVVEDTEIRDWVWERPQLVADLVGGKTHPTYVVFAVEELLSQLDEDGRPTPYLCDALDLIESTPKARRTAWMESTREAILSRLSAAPASNTGDQATGIKAVDQARSLIAAGRWAEAQAALEKLANSTDPRTQGLAALYGAVIAAESTAAVASNNADPVEQMFHTAVATIGRQHPSDAFRARVNFGNYLLNRAQNRLYNLAVQAASGIESPLSRTLLDWNEARSQYDAALKLSAELAPHDQAAAQVNMSRLYAVADDLLASLEGSAEERQWRVGRRLAQAQAAQFAAAAAAIDSAEAVVKAAAHETTAHLAFRRGDDEAFRRAVEQALAFYGEAGSLIGLESCHRALALAHQRSADSAIEDRNVDDALRHYQIAALLGDLLRERIDQDKVGKSRAGFFARRAYVNEKLIELLIARGEYREALRYAEQAKARSLQDVLIGNGIPAAGAQGWATLDELLDNWPSDTIGLEYYLGHSTCWVFVVDRNGKVHVEQLQGSDKKPVQTSALVADIYRYLRGTQLQARKLYQQAVSGAGFDKQWQHDLNSFYQILMPESARRACSEGGNVVVVPHHVLHYFPFAALVTKTDQTTRDKLEMPQPSFLIDQPIDLTYAPSLVAWSALRARSSPPLRKVNAVGIVDFETAARLPGVEKDLQNLSSSFGDRLGTILAADAASEHHVTRLLGEPGMLFVATHGMNVADRPLASFLLCHRDQQDDGKLTSAEIYSAEVGAGMVVMSACYSGLADRSPMPGDDLFGLQRAFLHAGANTVVSGLWDVYDGTGPILMHSYFTQLKQGKPAATALAAAQREFLHERRENGASDPWIHPYFWSVYTCAGSGASRFRPE